MTAAERLESGPLFEFLQETLDAQGPVEKDVDLFRRYGIDGDDGSEFMQAFHQSFDVRLEGFRWYFHYAEEGFPKIGALFCKPPYGRVAHIPVTVRHLEEAIDKKVWPISYPEHQLPSKRWDIIIDWIFLGAILLTGIGLAVAGLGRGGS